jgi:multidrug resistance protein MdtO
MIAIPEPRRPPHSLVQFLARELAGKEGRGIAITRISVGCAITVTIAMVFQIPEPTYMAYIVFLISKDERSATFTSAVGAMIAITAAIILCLALFMVDVAEPALRLPVMAVATFLGMYSSRTFALGPITYLAGFVLVLLQSLADDIPRLEALTRITLWLWVVAFVPVSVAVLMNMLAGQSAALLIKRTVLRVLGKVESWLLDGAAGLPLSDLRAEVLPLAELYRHQDPKVRNRAQVSDEVIRHLLDALTMLEIFPADTPENIREAIALRIRASRLAIEQGRAADTVAPAAGNVLQENSSPAILALEETFEALGRSIGRHPPVTTRAPAPAKHALFVPDAFTNPDHARFAFKSAVAVMTVYAIYTLLNYPGMRTSIVTCFFVSLASLGESVHKLLLRISGAVIGGSVAALCIVFVLPSLTDIGQLAVLIAIVSAGCAWVATSSERLSYAGMQIAFAFFLGVLQGYAPANDLTVLRDRVAGILLGNIAVTIIFSTVWPESASTRVRAALAELFRSIGALLRGGGSEADTRLRAAKALVQADQYEVMREFELQMLDSHRGAADMHPSVHAAARVAAASMVARSEPLLPYSHPDLMTRRARWAERAAECIALSAALPAPPAASSAPSDSAPVRIIARRVDQQLQSEIENAVAAPG